MVICAFVDPSDIKLFTAKYFYKHFGERDKNS